MFRKKQQRKILKGQKFQKNLENRQLKKENKKN